jgi:ribosomal protein S12 methylthiotransferase
MKVAFVSLGCDKNLADSEHMLFLLKNNDMEIVEEKDADVIIINTCCFIQSSLEESIQTILDCAKYKTEGNLKGLVITGCMSGRYKDEIRRDIPEVDTIVGINSYDKIVQAVKESVSGNKTDIDDESITSLPDDGIGRISATGMPYDYLKIAEGCDKRCTYCAIPNIRGPYRSIPMDVLLKEARQMAESGITEINIVAQETTIYGIDIYGERKLPELLNEISKIDGIEWIRVLYTYPESIDDDFINCMASNSKIVHYIDMPIQHADDYILRKMGRRTSRADIVALVQKLRDKIPDISLRTTLISGFPGETDDMHDTTKKFIKEVRFDRLGVFAYSREEGTPAYDFPDQVPDEIKEKRKDELMLMQQVIAFEKNKNLIDTDIDVFVEGYLPEKNVYVGRTYRDAPDVDSYIFIKSDIELISGTIIKVHVTDSKDYDLYGEIKL